VENSVILRTIQGGTTTMINDQQNRTVPHSNTVRLSMTTGISVI